MIKTLKKILSEEIIPEFNNRSYDKSKMELVFNNLLKSYSESFNKLEK